MSYPKLIPEFKTAWCLALRSGNYAQTEQFLHDADGFFCCLGVACEIMKEREPKLEIEWREEGRDTRELTLTFMDSRGNRFFQGDEIIPNELFPYIFQEPDLDIGDATDLQRQLTDMNDDKGNTFDEIADWIEEHL